MFAQTYDIFRREIGREIWVEAVRDLETAKSRVIELAADTPWQYVVLSQRSGRMVSSGTVVASPAARVTPKEMEKSEEAGDKSVVKESETLW